MFLPAIAIGQDPELQQADRDSDENIIDIRMRIREINFVDSLRSRLITHMVENVGLYENIDEWATNADIPRGNSYTSLRTELHQWPIPRKLLGNSKYWRRPAPYNDKSTSLLENPF